MVFVYYQAAKSTFAAIPSVAFDSHLATNTTFAAKPIVTYCHLPTPGTSLTIMAIVVGGKTYLAAPGAFLTIQSKVVAFNTYLATRSTYATTPIVGFIPCFATYCAFTVFPLMVAEFTSKTHSFGVYSRMCM